MKRQLLIIGFGSAGRRFADLAKKHFSNLSINVLTKQKNIGFNTISSFNEIKKINPDFFIISSSTKLHLEHLKFINRVFKNKIIFIEKPLFHKYENLKNIKNKIFVGFNMRNLNIIKFLKTFIQKYKKNIYEINFINQSYLPSWRENIDYKKSSSAKKSSAGGVILDCSHELDLATWMLGKINLIFVHKSKVSKLKIETEDNCKIYGKHQNIKIDIDLNYYSLKRKRKICIFGKQFELVADLVTAKVLLFKNKKKQVKIFNKKELKKSYLLELKNFIYKKDKSLANYNTALITQKFIQNIQNFK